MCVTIMLCSDDRLDIFVTLTFTDTDNIQKVIPRTYIFRFMTKYRRNLRFSILTHEDFLN